MYPIRLRAAKTSGMGAGNTPRRYAPGLHCATQFSVGKSKAASRPARVPASSERWALDHSPCGSERRRFDKHAGPRRCSDAIALRAFAASPPAKELRLPCSEDPACGPQRGYYHVRYFFAIDKKQGVGFPNFNVSCRFRIIAAHERGICISRKPILPRSVS